MPTFPTLTCTLRWRSVSRHSPVAKSDRSAVGAGGEAGPWSSCTVQFLRAGQMGDPGARAPASKAPLQIGKLRPWH